MVDYARTTAEGGRFDGVVDLTRLTDGRVMCATCFHFTPRDQLWVDDAGITWDLCAPCGAFEQHVGRLIDHVEAVVGDGDLARRVVQRLLSNGLLNGVPLPGGWQD